MECRRIVCLLYNVHEIYLVSMSNSFPTLQLFMFKSFDYALEFTP